MSTHRSLRDLAQLRFSTRLASLTAPPLPGAPLSFGHVARGHVPIVLTLVATAAAIYAGVIPVHQPHALVTMLAVFAGALVAGLAGFAFSAIAGAILFHWLPPVEAVPLLLACSITTQVFGVARLWRAIRWRDCAPYVLGGLLGIPLGAHLLARLNADVFVASFGVFLVGYSTYMTFRPNLTIQSGGRALEGVAGFLGGITGGATAFPGAIPTIWCNARGFTKLQQRGIIQPYILLMQVATLVYFAKAGMLSSAAFTSYVWCLPAIVLGTLIGFAVFDRIDEAKFKRVTLVFLFASGLLLAL
jgi:uncharacterized membrane protein YfcA